MKNNTLRRLLFPALAVAITAIIVTSCGKGNTVSPTSLNIRLAVINTSPDAGPIAFYIGYTKQFNTNFIYNSTSPYYYLTRVDTPYQIRTALSSGATLFTLTQPFVTGNRYTVYLTGLVSDKNLSYLFTSDSAAAPAIGRGKIRFINLSPRAGGLDIYANGTMAFQNQVFKAVSSFIEVPAGMYNFTMYNTGDHSNLLGSLNSITVQDGRLYTIYTHGMIGRTDTAAFAGAVLTNK